MHPKYLAASISIHAAREGGDIVARFVEAEFRISIHAAREGGDTAQTSSATLRRDFNPRRP